MEVFDPLRGQFAMFYTLPDISAMTPEAKQVLNGWLHLSDEQQHEVRSAIRALESVKDSDRIRFAKELPGMLETGPLAQPCSCCGRR
jgi:hypothetical protein